MAYSAHGLTCQFEGGSGFAKVWRYYTTDSLATVVASGYFNSKVTEMTVGDIIELVIVDAVASASRAAFTAKFELYVASNNGTTVTTALADATVNVTAATVTLGDAHNRRIVTLNRAGGIAVTLPAATGSGFKTRLIVGTTFTSSATVKVTGDDTMVGSALILQDGGDTAVHFEANGTDDTITMDGTTTGGLAGAYIDLVDIAADLWFVRYVSAATGTEADPFSATV